MSRMGTMVKTIRQNGEMKRTTWDPAHIVGLSGWPLRNYLWWREKTGYDGPENFCHFMRVAMIWAPLRRVGSFVDETIGPKRFIAGLVGLNVVVMLLTADDMLSALMFLLAVCALAVGVVGAFELLVRATPTLSRMSKWFFGAHPSFASWLRPWVVVAATIVALAPFSAWAFTAAQIIVIILFFAGVMIGGGWWTDRQVTARRAREDLVKQQLIRVDREMFFTALFSVAHPEWVDDDARFARWLERYRAWYLKETGNDIDTMRLTQIAYSAPWQARPDHYEALSRYEQKRREATEPVEAKPAKARRRIIPLAVVTFFQLVWALVVTNKWKICPIISIPTPQES